MLRTYNTKLIEYFLNFESLFSRILSEKEASKIKIIETFLSGLSNLDFFEKIYLYLTNEDTFLFDYFGEYPNNENNEKIELIDLLGTTEILNTTILTLQIQTYKNTEGKTFLVVPLVSFNRLLGFVVIKANIPEKFLTIFFLRLLKVFFNQFSTAIDLLNQKDLLNQEQDKYRQLLATQSLETQRANLEYSERMKEITTNLSMILPHEIRTPINQILGSTKLLKEYAKILPEEDSAGIIEIVNDIDASINRLRKLSENYLFYSNLVIISNDISKLHQITRDVVLSPQSVIFDRCMIIANNLGGQNRFFINLVDAPIKMNEIYLNKIVEELMDNAFKFCYPNSKVKVSSHIEENYYVLTFFNEGEGLSQEEIEIIQPFLQFERVTKEQQGSGLGLSIVFKIMNIYGGRVKINSEKGKFFEINLYFNIANV